MRKAKLTSVCMFGSLARNGTDALSDKDVLIVDDVEAIYSDACKTWEDEGWNVTHFQRGRFRRMAEVKALFVQHIKQEGKVISDDDGFLRSVLSTYIPAASYLDELHDALHQLSELPDTASTYWAKLCLSDAAFVLFRNAAIFFLANEGKYVFSYKHLVEHIGQQLGWTEQQRNSVLRLRSLKHAYRNRVTGAEVQNSLEVVKRLSSELRVGEPRPDQSSIRSGRTTDIYFRLRLTEIGMVGVHDPRYLDTLTPDDGNYDVWQSIRRAGGYPKPKGVLVESCHGSA